MAGESKKTTHTEILFARLDDLGVSSYDINTPEFRELYHQVNEDAVAESDLANQYPAKSPLPQDDLEEWCLKDTGYEPIITTVAELAASGQEADMVFKWWRSRHPEPQMGDQ